MYKILYIILLIIGIGSFFYNYKKGKIKGKDIGGKALAVSIILIIILGLSFLLK